MQACRAVCCWMVLQMSIILLVAEDRGQNAVCAWQACIHKPRITFCAQQEREQRLAACKQAAAKQQRDAAECSARAQAQHLEVERAGRALQAERAELQVTTGLNPEGAHPDNVVGQAVQGLAAACRPARLSPLRPAAAGLPRNRISWQVPELCMHAVAVSMPCRSPSSRASTSFECAGQHETSRTMSGKPQNILQQPVLMSM